MHAERESCFVLSCRSELRGGSSYNVMRVYSCKYLMLHTRYLHPSWSIQWLMQHTCEACVCHLLWTFSKNLCAGVHTAEKIGVAFVYAKKLRWSSMNTAGEGPFSLTDWICYDDDGYRRCPGTYAVRCTIPPSLSSTVTVETAYEVCGSKIFTIFGRKRRCVDFITSASLPCNGMAAITTIFCGGISQNWRVCALPIRVDGIVLVLVYTWEASHRSVYFRSNKAIGDTEYDL